MEKVLFSGPITGFFLSHLPISYLMHKLTILNFFLRVSQFIDNGQWDIHLLSSMVDVDLLTRFIVFLYL